MGDNGYDRLNHEGWAAKLVRKRICPKEQEKKITSEILTDKFCVVCEDTGNNELAYSGQRPSGPEEDRFGSRVYNGQ